MEARGSAAGARVRWSAVTAAAELVFATATEADVPALVSLVESAYRGEASRAGWTTEADLLDGQRTDPQGVLDTLRDPAGLVLTATRPGAAEPLLACCHLQYRPAADGPDAVYFGMFAVRPTAQGGGIGAAVLAHAEHTARTTWAAARMEMQVISARADLIAWYERRGYTRTGERTPFPYGDERFGIPRRPGLEFELLVKPLR
ncbi:GNAT family N-acetyltransferase [Streptomyces carpaticus]|uniref:GNAT family N-acetyltransferase n=1 Tax=Streptomyces carpaticus TaxID=285558 RepID=A0ABV4ZKI9_9ACTN